MSSKFEGELNVNKLERWVGNLMKTKAEDLFVTKGSCCKGNGQEICFPRCPHALRW